MTQDRMSILRKINVTHKEYLLTGLILNAFCFFQFIDFFVIIIRSFTAIKNTKHIYECEECDRYWENVRSLDEEAKVCRICGNSVWPYIVKDSAVSKTKSRRKRKKKSVIDNEPNKKKFCYYECKQCGRTWQSAHSWGNMVRCAITAKFLLCHTKE